ncbi:MAG: hypothetical protein EPN62_00740 [Candidimonas sp.]|nr:MAG: hypothetical protein EPN77_01740 [Candidimonas sp.]TAM26857.1 MAG: hypothetical protein EPN62_00740 [Candidimonas sp.]
MKTLLLDRTAWDLVLDASGNIALASNPYAIAQDVASAVKLFKGELWYDTTKGIPYFQEILGQWPPIALIRAYVEKAALTVPEVVQAQCTIVSTTDRTITGRVEVIDVDGQTHNVTF